MNKMLSIANYVKSKSYPKYIRNIFKNVETQISWNLSLPFRINKNGKIKKNLKSKVLDDIRNSYGIDLTLEIELEKEALNIEKERLKSTINNLKSKNDKENLVRYKNTLSRFLNRNDTYNKYSLRRKKFNYNNLDRMVASFLIVTGQVEYSRNGYTFVIDKPGYFHKVTDFKSFDKKETFYQKVFNNTLYIKAVDLKSIEAKNCSLTKFLNKGKLLKNSTIKYNRMYKGYILSKIKKMSVLLTEDDTKAILKALYDFKLLLTLHDKKDFEDRVRNSFNSFVELFQKEENKSALRKAIKGCFPGSRLKNKQIDNFLSCFKGYLSTYFISIDSLSERVKKEIGNKYVLKSELDSIIKEKIKDNYVLKSDLDGIIKERIEGKYVLKSEFEKLKKRFS